jgi:phosphate-selective porin OprO/OprP
MVHNKHFNNRFTWAVGYFFPSGSVGKYLGDQYRITARITGLPVYKTDGQFTVLHIGLAYENQFQNNEEFTLSERPEAHLAPKYVNLKIDALSRADVISGELSFVIGRFAVQGEYMMANVNPDPSSSAVSDSYYFFATYANFSWFITGEHRNYNQSKSAFDKVTPRKNLGKGGAGAWEIVFRLSHIDLNDKDLNGGLMTDFTAGLNWYLNPAVKIKFNYIYSDLLDKGSANIAMVRFQVVF